MFGITAGKFHRDLSAQAAGYQMIRPGLYKLGQIRVQLFHQVIDSNRQAGINSLVQSLAVIYQQIGHENVKISPPIAMIAVPRLGLFGQAIQEYQGRLSPVTPRFETGQPHGPLRSHCQKLPRDVAKAIIRSKIALSLMVLKQGSAEQGIFSDFRDNSTVWHWNLMVRGPLSGNLSQPRSERGNCQSRARSEAY
jgi:hypothetical protein